MRISDWSSDVGSSDLDPAPADPHGHGRRVEADEDGRLSPVGAPHGREGFTGDRSIETHRAHGALLRCDLSPITLAAISSAGQFSTRRSAQPYAPPDRRPKTRPTGRRPSTRPSRRQIGSASCGANVWQYV